MYFVGQFDDGITDIISYASYSCPVLMFETMNRNLLISKPARPEKTVSLGDFSRATIPNTIIATTLVKWIFSGHDEFIATKVANVIGEYEIKKKLQTNIRQTI